MVGQPSPPPIADGAPAAAAAGSSSLHTVDRAASGCRWRRSAGPSPIPVTHGAEGALALMKGFNEQHDLTTIEVDILRIGQADGAVYTERIDHLVNSQGTRFLSIPVAGVMTLDAEGASPTGGTTGTCGSSWSAPPERRARRVARHWRHSSR
jgi:limonene-1,2-epoxide hydrolase